MDEKRPKRRKDKYNPYTLTEKEDKHFLSFRDGQGVLWELQITKELFEVLNRFELDDLSILNEWDRHYEHSELTETSLYDRAAMLPESVEETVFRNLRYETLYKAMEQLPETQRRRLVLYYFAGFTYAQIADKEGCKYQTVQESIYAALKKLKKLLK
ncbi:MAG: sigma-70 family RNA polymerase sigma factor [Clostridiales bacterium]|nr:sigma-70 family RNA polymerase sigma factor [Clostridiales bacterium]